MDKFELINTVFNKIIKIYDEKLFKKLNNKAEGIIQELEEVFDKFANDFDLKSSNDVYEKKFYKFEYRIKSTKSLKEKFIRKNLGLKFINDHNIKKIEDVDEKETLIIKDLQQLDDIIGIKIVTELQLDCEPAFYLLKDNVDKLEEKNIKFTDLEMQPVNMKNGLPIYNIKGKYFNEFAFELQIKSKISSAWGDLDHTIFYKDYTVTPIKDAVQVTMVHVGKILDQLEHLLYEIRESNKDFDLKAENFNFLKRIFEELGPLIGDKFQEKYDLVKIADILRFFYYSFGKKANRLSNIDYNFLNFMPTNENLKKYSVIRENNFELMILELVYFNWLHLFKDETLNKDNYEDHLNEYLNIMNNYISESLKDYESNKNKRDTFVVDTKSFLVDHSASCNIYISNPKYLLSLKVKRYFDESLSESISEIEKLYNLFLIYLFSGNEVKYISQFDNLTTSLVQLRDVLKGEDNGDEHIIILEKFCKEKLEKQNAE